ncbi:MAG: hypothetical protein F083_3270, partial [bacterium F083]
KDSIFAVSVTTPIVLGEVARW